MKLKIDFAAFQSAIMAPGVIGSEVTLTKSTKYKEVEMEFIDGVLAIQVTKNAKTVYIPSTNIKSMTGSDITKK